MQIFNLPDILSNPKPFVEYIINDVKYRFQFDWQGDCAFCTAYFSDGENKNQYLFKGKPLTINNNLIGRVKNPQLITGALFLMNVYAQSVEPLQENFSSDYQLVYISEEDLKNV